MMPMRSLLPLGGRFTEVSALITQLSSQEVQQMGSDMYEDEPKLNSIRLFLSHSTANNICHFS